MMKKLPMCRICLSEDVRMYVVINKDLHELYEKMINIPFVTEDARPILACFICWAKFKQCYRFMAQCFRAEELFAEIMSANYQINRLENQDRLKIFGGLVRTPIESINIVDTGLTETIFVKEESPAVSTVVDNVIEPKEEHLIDDDDAKEDTLEIFVEEELPGISAMLDGMVELKEEPLSDDLKDEILDVDGYSDEEDELLKPYRFEKYSEGDVPSIAITIEREKKISKLNRQRTETNRLTVAEEPKLHLRRTRLEDSKPTNQKRDQSSSSKIIRTTQNRSTKFITKFKKPHGCHICHVCHCMFTTKSDCKRHLRTHTGEKPYKCNRCKSSFTQNSHLIDHLRTHTGEKPYKCDLCQKNFSKKVNLTDHIRVHTGEKPFKCDVCQTSFGKKATLSKHIRTHTGDKPYKCDICQHSFSQSVHLKDHLYIHAGVKPFKCDICKHSFRRKGNLIRHMRMHTDEKPYKGDNRRRGICRKGDQKNVPIKMELVPELDCVQVL